jgi:hypothetical protein
MEMLTCKNVAGVLFFIGMLSLSLIAAPAKMESWFVDSLTKVFPQTPPVNEKVKAPEFTVVRNQHLNLQLAVRCADNLQEITGRAEPLRDAKGGVIEEVLLRQVGYVVVGSNSEDTPPAELVGEAPGWYPDVLLPMPAALKAGRTMAFWVTIHVPATAVPGLYQGKIRLESGGKPLVVRSFQVNVLAAVLPEKRTLKVTNWFTLGDRDSKQFFNAPLYSESWWKLLANIAGFMADYRQNVIITGVQQLVQPNLENGQIRYDFSNFDRWVSTFEKAGALDYIEGGHLLDRAGGYNEPLQVTVFVVENGQARRISLPPDDPRVEPAMASFLEALNQHLEQNNWKAKYVQHILDEPHGKEPEYYGRLARMVHQYLPGVRTIDAIDAEHIPPELEQYCDIWVPILGHFDDKVDLLKKRMESGKEVWFYVCLFPRGSYMNRLIDFPLIKTRLLHWTDFRYDLTGFLHWGWNWWSPDPIKATQTVINMNETLLPAGDAFIVYPDKKNLTVNSTIRLEAMREGIEDYELLRALAQSKPEEARKLAESMVRSFTDYVRDPVQFRRIHQQLMDALSK